jgi:PAS domain S-box-containing protein
MLDLKTGRYVFISPAQAKLTGFTIEEINNISAEEVYDRVHPDDREISITQQKLVAAGDDPGSTVEYRWKVKGGEYRWFSDSRKLVRDAQGNPMALVGVSRDITERKEAEVALRKLNEELEDRVRQRTVEVLAERQRLYDVLETLPVYVALLDADYRVPFANRFFRERFGESKGRRCYEYLFGRAEPCEICDTYKVMETKSPHRWEWLGPDGRNYEIYDFPFYEADGSLQILEMGMDITESKKAKEALKTERDSLEARVAERTEELQKINEALRMRTSALMVSNKELEAFSYSVSHDLRAPLRVLDGFSLALAEDYCNSLDERAGDYIHRIRAASHRMANLIDDLLSLSRVARAEMAPRRVDLSEYARGILRDFREANAARDVEIEIGQGVFADGDPRLLKILLQNLLANAWKFSSKRAPARIEFGKIVQDGVDVFFVRDNGAGFDSKYADKLFVPFQRLHSATEFEGSGIGLAIVQRIVNRHGGRTWAEGEPDKGSTFYFTLNVN